MNQTAIRAVTARDLDPQSHDRELIQEGLRQDEAGELLEHEEVPATGGWVGRGFLF